MPQRPAWSIDQEALFRRSAAASLNATLLMTQQSALIEKRVRLHRENLRLMQDLARAGRHFIDIVAERLAAEELRLLSGRSPQDAGSPELT